MKFIIFIIALLSLINSCGTHYELSEEDIKWQPYNGGEILIFKSNSGEIDTLFVEEKIEMYTGEKGPDWFQFDDWDYLEVNCTMPSSSNLNNKENYYTFLSLNSSKTGSYISFSFSNNNVRFYSSNYIIKNLIEKPLIELENENMTFSDVLVLESDNKDYSYRKNFITKIYWSKSKGYVRYELENGSHWDLISIGGSL